MTWMTRLTEPFHVGWGLEAGGEVDMSGGREILHSDNLDRLEQQATVTVWSLTNTSAESSLWDDLTKDLTSEEWQKEISSDWRFHLPGEEKARGESHPRIPVSIPG